MHTIEFKSKAYKLDADDFLANFEDWAEDFAEAMAPGAGISGGLTDHHRAVLKFIRNSYMKEGRCPLVHKACKAFRLRSSEMEKLFPTGYRCGACKLAGLAYICGDA